MSTTVTYKGTTLTTVENQTRTLETAGTYLEDDITLTDVTQGGGVTTAYVTEVYTSYIIYYTDENMTVQSATEIVDEYLPVGTLVFIYNEGPSPFLSQYIGLTLLRSWGSEIKGQYLVYEVTG